MNNLDHSIQNRAHSHIPSIWLAEYSSKEEYDNDKVMHDFFKVAQQLDNDTVKSLDPYVIQAYCEVCGEVRQMLIQWSIGGFQNGSIVNSWGDSIFCGGCGLNNRMRAMIDFLNNVLHVDAENDNIYVAERLTTSYAAFEKKYNNLTGSEYLGDDFVKGEFYETTGGTTLQHQDLTDLKYPDNTFDITISQHVLEHVYGYPKAFKESYRVLKDQGYLVFSIPFYSDLYETVQRATIDDTGKVVHILPPEIHANPVGDGSLCFQNIGWDILNDIRDAGFINVKAHLCWGNWKGNHGFGFPQFVFCGQKAVQ